MSCIIGAWPAIAVLVSALAWAGSQPASAAQDGIVWTSPRPGPGPKGAAVLSDGSILCARTEGMATGVRVVCLASADRGRTWQERATIVDGPMGADIGDGCLLSMGRGELLYSYRDNRTTGQAEPTYAIRVVSSSDSGRTWKPHSTVADCRGARGGLWSSFLLKTPAGKLLCLYDDERTPWDAGFARHQWLTARTWDGKRREWVDPVTVSRADDPAHLSRDGMASAVVLPNGHILCVFETVDTAPPHAGVIMSVESADGGKTWSWKTPGRRMVYQARDHRFGAYCPWVALTPERRLVCVFGLNEGREKPNAPGTPPPDLGMDIVAIESRDLGQTWSAPAVVHAGSHRSFMPGVVALPGRPADLLCHWIDADRGCLVAEGSVPR